MQSVISSEPAIFLIYLFYGAVFFAIGVAITSRHKTISNLKIAGSFNLFSLFAFLHSFHEWLELFLKMSLLPEGNLLVSVYAFNLFLVFFSFLFLYIFGVHLIDILYPQARIFFYSFGLFLAVIFLLFLLENLASDKKELIKIIDFGIRRSLGFSATIITGTAFILYSRQLKILTRKGGGNFFGAGVALLSYGILTGLVPSTTPLVAGVPVEVFRALAALAMLHFIMYGLDIFFTEKEEMIAERLQHAARSERLTSLGRLAAGIAHEINNPLASVSLQLEMLGKELARKDLTEKTRQRLHTIEHSVDKTAMIARELLLFASDKAVDHHHEKCNLEKIINSAWKLITPRTNTIRLAVNQSARQLVVHGVALKLEELFVNLFLNAVDAMPDGGVIKVKGRLVNRGIFVSIHDQGAGISREKLDLVTEPFYTTKEIGAGTGLGLSICHGIMEIHGGSINIDSQPGQGTTIILHFPEG
jgi:signal transduction histidine kinase